MSVLAAVGVPEIVGRAVFAGGEAGAGGGATRAVGADVDEVEPFLFDATTVTRIVEPTSVDVSTYVLRPEPAANTVQLALVVSQRFHLNE